jgi:anti-anti-sigma factor
MKMIICNDSAATAVAEEAAMELTELVRGKDQSLLDQMVPVVARQTTVLDMNSVERIDAAGIAALVTLYATACQAGHTFTVANVKPRVKRILALVGLDQILLSQNADQSSQSGACFQRSAA